MGWFELHGIAEGAVATGEHLGGKELRVLLESSSEDLNHISYLLGAPRRIGEPPATLLVRLLRLTVRRAGASPAQFSAADAERLAARLDGMLAAPRDAQVARRPPPDSGSAADEFDTLLREIEPRRDAPKRKGGTTPVPPDAPRTPRSSR
jgi:hypothetical protein